MKKTLLNLSLSALIGSLAVPTAASANDMVDSWLNSLYVSTFVDGHFLHDIETDVTYVSTNPTSHEHDTYEQEASFATRFAVGGHVNSYLRAELELGFSRSNQGPDILNVSGGTSSTWKGQGQIDAYTLMGNAWFDLPVFDNTWGLTPYVGGGIGVALVDSQLAYTGNVSAYGPQGSSVEFAAQLGAGINWAFNNRFSAGLGYRLMFINGPEISQPTNASINEITTYQFDDLLSQSVGITLTMNIN